MRAALPCRKIKKNRASIRLDSGDRGSRKQSRDAEQECMPSAPPLDDPSEVRAARGRGCGENQAGAWEGQSRSSYCREQDRPEWANSVEKVPAAIFGAMIRCSGAGIFWPRGAALMPSIAPGSIPSTTIEAEWPVALKSPMVEGWRIRRDHRKGGIIAELRAFRSRGHQLVRRPSVVFGLVVILFAVGGAMFAPVLAPFDPNAQMFDGLTLEGAPLSPGGAYCSGRTCLGGICSRGCSMGREPRLSSGSLRTGRQF